MVAFDSSTLENLLRDAFPDGIICVQDTVGDRNHFAVHITSHHFCGKTRVAQHQMVYTALKGHAGEAIHALSVTTRCP